MPKTPTKKRPTKRSTQPVVERRVIAEQNDMSRIGRLLRGVIADLKHASRVKDEEVRIGFEYTAGQDFLKALKLAGVKFSEPK